MSNRKYLNKTIAELEELFEKGRHEPRIVDELGRELKFRTTPRARVLALKVARHTAHGSGGERIEFVVPKQSHLDFGEREAVENVEATPSVGRTFKGDIPQNGPMMSADPDQDRLSNLYEGLRLKLLDLSKKNRMLNYPIKPRAKNQLQIVDEVLEGVYAKLINDEVGLKLQFLPEPDSVPADERTSEFLDALEHAKVADLEFVTAVEKLAADDADDEFAVERLERHLRDRLRSKLDMPPRQKRTEINRNDHARSLGIDPKIDLEASEIKSAHSDNALQTLKYPDELEAIMGRISDQARLAEQEAGLSTLFLGLGFLEWYESDDSEKAYYAPLLLLPVKVHHEKVKGKDVYHLEAREEEAEVNVSLMKFLETRFGRDLPLFGSDEEGPETVEAYLAEVVLAIEGLKRWRVRRWLVLGHFAFSRIAIYEDTKPERWSKHPATHPLVGSLLSGYEAGEADDDIFSRPDDYNVDNAEIEAIAPILIQDADASQHSALVDVMKNKNLVIQGPPGTGKSQTITNIIANVLAAGKSVLFLAEKQAALDVVQRRMKGAGLGDFCLEIHSDKSSPKAIVSSLSSRWDMRFGAAGAPLMREDPLWRESRAEIGDYLDALHLEDDDGETPHKLIWKSLRLSGENAASLAVLKNVILGSAATSDVLGLPALRGRLEMYASSVSSFQNSFSAPQDSPWNSVSLNDVPHFEQARMFETIAALSETAAALQGLIDVNAVRGISSPSHLEDIAETVTTIPEQPLWEVLSQILHADIDDLLQAVSLKRRGFELDREIAASSRGEVVTGQQSQIAVTLIAAVPRDVVKTMTADALFADLRAAAEHSKEKAFAITAIKPACDVLGISAGDLLGVVAAIATVSAAVKGMSEEDLRWFGATREDAKVVSEQSQTWRKLVENETLIKTLFPNGSRGDWPSPETLEPVIESFRKTGVKRFVQSMSGGLKASRRFVLDSGYEGSEREVAIHLDALLAHVLSVAEFEKANPAAAALGPLWKGLDTPFDAIAEEFSRRASLKEALALSAHGKMVDERFFCLPASAMAKLGKHADALEVAKTQILQMGISERTIVDYLGLLKQEVQAAQSVLQLDPDRILSGSKLTLGDLSEIGRLQALRLQARTDFHSWPHADLTDSLVRGLEDIPTLLTAMEWKNWVSACELPEPVSNALLSESLFETVIWLQETAAAFLATTTEHDIALDAVKEFGFSALEPRPWRDVLEQMQDLAAHKAELNDWLSVRRQRRQLDGSGLEDFLRACDTSKVAPSDLAAHFDWVLSRQRVNGRRRQTTALSRFTGTDLDSRRKTFADRDKQKIVSDRTRVRTYLVRRQPPAGLRAGSVKTWTQMALLVNEFPKQKRFTPVRGLLERAGSAVQHLKPCFMMSPLSLAKFLPQNALTFDVLIIDEASQMRPEDALGAMLRSRQIVVVGDQKQLPPTSFFERTSETDDTEDEDAETIDDESILERCQKVFREVRGLKWHYRSRCESLIRFSNENFYGNSLITFPAAKPNSFSVELVRVAGTNQARRNLVEAERISEEAMEFMRHHASLPWEEMPTLGIVALNSDQRELISETLRRLSANDELVEDFIEKAEKKGEPLFVKNLENVQGDERDFIFISMTYGPAPGSTRIMQRFGPINTRPGHRRLNVLFSRARIKIAIFSSFGSADVLPTPTSREGLHVLKRYFEYAETKGRAAVERIGTEPDSDFEIEVAQRMRKRGYQIDLQVGVSGFRIDLGVRHPDNPEIFLAGIECDGAQYHSSKSARDRDRLREEVLNGLGWRLVRVWSTDWFDDPERETDRLVAKLEAIRSQAALSNSEYRFSNTYIETPADFETQGAATIEPIQKLASDQGEEEATLPEDGEALLTGNGPLTDQEAVRALITLRETHIRLQTHNWEAHRSILRDGLIETFVKQRIREPDEWFTKVPQYLRSGTDGSEKRIYLERICEVIGRLP